MTTPATLSNIDLTSPGYLAYSEGLNSYSEMKHRMLQKDGTYRQILSQGLAGQDTNGRAYRMGRSYSDTTARTHAEKQLLHYYAFHDALTGLPNRILFMAVLGRAVERAKRREDYSFAVLFLDFDDFKAVNDTLGHEVGDQLLIGSAHRLEACLRTEDTAARLGGDEFVILLEDIRDVNDATRIAERVQTTLALPFLLNGHEVCVSVSIGIAMSETGYRQPEDVLRDADIAMYRAKAQGKVCHEVFDTAMRAHAAARRESETGLRRALERQELRLHYQPIVSLATGRLAGLEALLRWQHPQRGLIPPAEIIPIAEETGLIAPIGRWVLREACRQVSAWRAQFPTDPPLTVSVNLSGRQFAQPDLVEQIEQILQETGLNAGSLRLELTESVLMKHAECATTTLSQLQNLGVQVQIDDFGTGYSSLGYLQHSSLNTIKVDRTFVGRMGVNGDNSGVVRAIVALAHNLDMEVIAEGVETAEQLAQLKALECEYGQGNHISRPVDSEAAAAFIAKAIAKNRVTTTS
jgi:diguanylate cyclase (GGDEF)-like protein